MKPDIYFPISVGFTFPIRFTFAASQVKVVLTVDRITVILDAHDDEAVGGDAASSEDSVIVNVVNDVNHVEKGAAHIRVKRIDRENGGRRWRGKMARNGAARNGAARNGTAQNGAVSKGVVVASVSWHGEGGSKNGWIFGNQELKVILQVHFFVHDRIYNSVADYRSSRVDVECPLFFSFFTMG